MKVVRFTKHRHGYTLRFGYDPVAVDLIKQTVPSHGRSWDPDLKQWEVDERYVKALAVDLRSLGFQVLGLDAAPPPPPPPRAGGSDWAATLFATLGPARSTLAYRALSRVLHPDTPTGDLGLQQQLNDAYQRLPRGK